MAAHCFDDFGLLGDLRRGLASPRWSRAVTFVIGACLFTTHKVELLRVSIEGTNVFWFDADYFAQPGSCSPIRKIKRNFQKRGWQKMGAKRREKETRDRDMLAHHD